MPSTAVNLDNILLSHGNTFTQVRLPETMGSVGNVPGRQVQLQMADDPPRLRGSIRCSAGRVQKLSPIISQSCITWPNSKVLAMAEQVFDPNNEETIETSISMELLQGDTERNREAARGQVALVEGSSPHLSHETLALLRDRLRMVALLLFTGFTVFLVRALWAYDHYVTGPGASTFYAHVAVTLVLAVMAQRLCTECDFFMTHLRWAELLVIGSPAAFFLFSNYSELALCSSADVDHAHVPTIVSPWMLLLFCYALFVPNSWRRAAVVLGLLGLGPILVMATAYFRLPEFAELLHHPQFRNDFYEIPLLMALNVLIATVGVATIGSLRREAFVARQLGQYRLTKLLGSGGMGQVYLAEHEMMKRPCAVKVIRPEKAGDPKNLARFEREVRATAKLSHWNSIDIFDYGRTDDGTFYYVMEFLPGHNLGELVNGHGPLPAARIVYLMRQICDALAEAHGQDLIHRDIKPANIYCAYRGGVFDVAKLLDFGLAKPLADATDSELTQAGSITGSPLYMSPEQATGGEEVDVRSDIYSLGAVMYFMATGRPPFVYPQPIKVMVAHASESPRPPREITPNIPLELEEIILRCLEKQAEDRFQDVAALRDSLEEIPLRQPWSADQAASWWHDYGCPERKALASAVVEMAAV